MVKKREESAVVRVGSSELAVPTMAERALWESMYPERVLRFPKEIVGTISWHWLGGDWEETSERFDACGNVRIPAGCRAQLSIERNSAEYLRGFGDRDLQGLKVRWDTALLQCIEMIADGCMSGLERLHLIGNQVIDVSSLTRLTKLRELCLCHAKITDVSLLAKFTQLQVLDLSSAEVRDVCALATLTQLRSLCLSNTQVIDVSSLAGLTQLRELDLSETQVSDVRSLAGLRQLRELDLHSTQVSDVSSTAGLTQLQVLDLSSTQVSDVSLLAGPALSTCVD
jgi:Leucine-rich repeat (LRR) protein